MARPTDWSALELWGDPVPGDTAAIRADARALKQIAALITEQATKLRAVTSKGEDAWLSDAGKNFTRNAGDLADQIDKSHGRYEATGNALAAYADDLDDVQATADRLLQQARDAQDDKRRAQHTILPDESDPGYDYAHSAKRRQLSSADGALQQAINGIENLIGPGGAWTAANHKAAKAIRDAAQDDLVDHFWKEIGGAIVGAIHWMSSLENIKKVLGVISFVLTIAVIVALIIVPGGQILAALMIAAFVVAALNFGATLAQHARGEDHSKTDLIWAGLGVVLSAFGAAGGIKILSAAAKAGELGDGAGRLAPAISKTGAFWERMAGSKPVETLNSWNESLEKPLSTATSRLTKSLSMANANRVRAAGGDFGEGLRASRAAIAQRVGSRFGRTAVALDDSLTGGGAKLLLTKGTDTSTNAWSIVKQAVTGKNAILTGINGLKAGADGAAHVHEVKEHAEEVRELLEEENSPSVLAIGGGAGGRW